MKDEAHYEIRIHTCVRKTAIRVSKKWSFVTFQNSQSRFDMETTRSVLYTGKKTPGGAGTHYCRYSTEAPGGARGAGATKMVQVAGNGSEADIARARIIVASDEIVLAIWKPTPGQATSEACLLFQVFLLPCYWPCLIGCSPLFISCFLASKRIFEHSMMILTDKKLYRDVSVGSETGCFHIQPGAGSASIYLNEIASIDEFVSRLDETAFKCRGPPHISLRLYDPTGVNCANQDMANAGGNKWERTHCQFIVDDDQQAEALIRAARDTFIGLNAMAA